MAALNVFMASYLQLMGIAATTVFITHRAFIANFLAVLMVNALFIYNTNRVVKGTRADKWAYVLGAAFGSVSGAFLGGMLV